MLSTADKKYVRKLRQKKYRHQAQMFLAEGPKVVKDLLESGLPAQQIFALQPEQWPRAQAVNEKELGQISQLRTPNEVVAVFPFLEAGPEWGKRVLILDKINDPGNLGTLLRTADWFGFRTVICINGTADVYNAKTVQSSMGSLGRVAVHYLDQEKCWSALSQYQVLRADMTGTAPDEIAPTDSLALIMGSESHGPSQFWQKKSTAISIAPAEGSAIDSLNVAVAGGILMHRLA